MNLNNPRVKEAIATAVEAAKAKGEELPFRARLQIAESTPEGNLAGDNLKILEDLAMHHLFGLALALKKGRCTKALKNLTASVMEELSKGPLQAHGYAHKGYGAIVEAINHTRDDANMYSQRTTAYRCAIKQYSYGAGFFWYQLQHLTDIPAYRDDNLAKCLGHVAKLTEMEP
jgi:hypothetical protein